MTNFTMKTKAGRVPVNWQTFIGEAGNIFWDMATGQMRLSDGHTPGGIPLGGGAWAGTIPPVNPSLGSLWFDPDSGQLYVYYDNSWVDANPMISGGNGNVSLGNLTITDQTIRGKNVDANIYIVPNGAGRVIINNLSSANLNLGNLSVNDQTISGSDINGDIVLTPNGTGFVSVPRIKILVGSVISGTTGTAILVTPLVLDHVLQTSTGSALPSGTYGNSGSIAAPWTAYQFTTDPSPVIQVNDVISGAGVPALSRVVFVGTGGNSKIVVVNATLTGIPAPQLPQPNQNMYVSRPATHDALTFSTASNTDVLFTPGTGGLTVSGASFLPSADNSYDLGNPLRRWREIYMGPASLFMLDAATNIDISIKALSGNLEVLGARGINVGEFQIYDNNITITDPTRDLTIGTAAATGYLRSNRPFKIVAGGTGKVAFQADRNGFVKIVSQGTILTTQAALEIVGSSTGNSQPRNFNGTLLQMTAQDGTAARVSIDAFGPESANAYPVIAGRRASGDVDNPTATQANDTLFRLSSQGYGSTGYLSSIGRMSFQAAQTFTDAHAGTRVRFQLTPTDSTTIQPATMDITANGISFLNNASGGIRYPDNTFQNTAYTGSIVSANITGNVVLKVTAGTGLSATGTDLGGGSWTGNIGLNTTDVHSITSADNVNQIIVTNDGVNNITLALPQDINTTSSPTFQDVYVTNLHVTGNTYTEFPAVTLDKTIYLANSATANTQINNGGLVLGTGAFQRYILYRLDSGVDYWDTGTAGFLTSNLQSANANVANLRVTNQGHFGTLAEIGDFANAVVQVDANVSTFAQMVIMNHSNNTSASSDVVATNDQGNDTSYFVDMGINSSSYDGSPDWTISAANDAYLYNKDGNLTVGTATAGKKIAFHTGGTVAANIRATISDTGISTPLPITSTIATGTAPFVVTSTTTVANLHVANATYATTAGTASSATTAATVTTAAQPNITSTGTLTTLNVSAQANATVFSSNIATGTAPLIVQSTTQVANLNVAAAGTAATVTAASQPNITAIGSLTSLTVVGNANVGNIGTTGVFVGNLTGSAATVTASSQPNITSTGTLTGLTVNGNANVGNIGATGVFVGNLTGNASGSAATVTASSQPNITSTGTLTTLTVSGNANVGNIGTTGVFVGNLTGNISGSAASATTAGTVTTGAQPNVTSVGTLAGVTVTANANVANLNVSGKSNLNSVSNVTITGGTSGQFLKTDGAGNLSFASFTVEAGSSIVNGTSNVSVALNSNVTVGVAGNAAILTVTGTGANIAGYLNVSSNISNANVIFANTFISNVSTGTAPFTVTSTTRVSNLNVANAGYADSAGTASSATSATTAGTVTASSQPNITSVGTLSGLTVTATITGNINGSAASATTAGTVTTAAQPNITSVGTLSSLTVTANANVGNLGTAGSISATGNITATANLTAGNISTGGVLSVTGNANVGNLGTAGLVVATGNVTGGNLVTGGVLSVTGNANVGNIGTARVLASANITAPQLISNVSTGTAPLVVSSTTQVANLNAQYSGNSVSATSLDDATSILTGKFTLAVNVGKNSLTTLTKTITGLTTNHKVIITPATAMPDNSSFFGAAWASASNTLSIQFATASGGVNASFDISYFAWI